MCLGGCRVGDNEDRSGCYLSLWAPLETWPMAPTVLVSLTSACDIITHCPDINPDTARSDKKSKRERGNSSQEVIRQTRGIVRLLLLLWVCLRRYEIFMETSYSVVCFHFRFNVFAFTEPRWSRGPRLAGRSEAAKRKKKGGNDGGRK